MRYQRPSYLLFKSSLVVVLPYMTILFLLASSDSAYHLRYLVAYLPISCIICHVPYTSTTCIVYLIPYVNRHIYFPYYTGDFAMAAECAYHLLLTTKAEVYHKFKAVAGIRKGVIRMLPAIKRYDKA